MLERPLIAAVFPGQGSQKPGMGRALYEAHGTFRETFDRIAAADGRDLHAIVFDGTEEELRRTENAQSALYACGVAAYRAYKAEGGLADLFAGHSIGEYAALAAAGILDDAEGAHLVRRRGELMAGAGVNAPGTMAAVLGLEIEAVAEALKGVSGTVVVANDNCPGQVVISGDVQGVAEATTRLGEAGAKRILPLNVSGAFHSPLMTEPAREMRAALDAAEWSAGAPVVANVLADIPQDKNWPDLLERQLASPVRWTESVRRMVALGAAEFIEFGAGEVLAGLVRRTDKNIATRRVAEPEDLTVSSPA